MSPGSTPISFAFNTRLMIFPLRVFGNLSMNSIPEGMAIAAPLLMGGLKKPVLFFQVLLLGVITPLGTILGFFLMEILPGILPWLLGFASGIMGYLVLCQLWPEAGRKGKSKRWKGLIIGVLIILLATFL